MKILKLPQIYPVTSHTDHVGPNSTFVAINGYKLNGAKFIDLAIKKGSRKIVLEGKEAINNFHNSKIRSEKGVEYKYVNNTRKTLAKISIKSLNDPASKLKIIGITGTKGKTTTTHLIEYILKKAGFKTALLGTIKTKILDYEIKSKRTTPESDFLNIFFNECLNKKVDFVIMEVSAHALTLERVYGIKFDAIGFTNLAAEHLDFYKNMNDYFKAKFKIFKKIKTRCLIVINNDDSWGKRAISILEKWKKKNKSNFTLIKFSKNNTKIDTKNLFGEFNRYNIAMAFLICKHLNIPTNKIFNAIKRFPGIDGRMQKHILKNKAWAFVDYAHNPSSFEEALKSLKKLNREIIVVFGCGGNRDKTKRPVMGKLASSYAQKIILTNDNPRFENKKKIIEEIMNGIDKSKQKNVICIQDRKIAIKKAVELSNKNSVIAILGKGHENYYIENGKKFYFNDFKEITKY